LSKRGQSVDFPEFKSRTAFATSIQKAFINIVMRSKEEISNILRKYDFTDIQMVHLDRTKPKGNRATAKTFAAKVDSRLSGFQDSDVILLALTVKHKP
jgi:cupin superfamily acireductone dioxygenase involved in methionine salvage